MSELAAGSTNPFLTRFATIRNTQPEIDGRYSDELDVWIRDVDGGVRPIVTADTALAGMVTKTATVQEQDDENFLSIPELATKTETQQESDDQISFSTLAEMVTKTYAQVESDDQGPEVF